MSVSKRSRSKLSRFSSRSLSRKRLKIIVVKSDDVPAIIVGCIPAASGHQRLVADSPANQQADLSAPRREPTSKLIQIRIRRVLRNVLALDKDLGRRVVAPNPAEEAALRHVRIGDVDPLSSLVNRILDLWKSEARIKQCRKKRLNCFVVLVGVLSPRGGCANSCQQAVQLRRVSKTLKKKVFMAHWRRNLLPLRSAIAVKRIGMLAGQLSDGGLVGAKHLLEGLLVGRSHLPAYQGAY